MNKYEKLIELIVNEDSTQAKKLFHKIVVEHSRNIYESLIDEADLSDAEDEIEDDEEGITEEDDSLDITVEEAKQLLDHIDGTLNESDAGDLLQRVAEHFNVKASGLISVLEANGDALLEMAYGDEEEDGEEDGEEDEFGADDAGDDDMGGEEDFGGDMGDDDAIGDLDDEAGEEGEEIEDRVVDLEDAIDELKSEFDALIGAEDEGMGDEMGMDDGMGMDDEMGMDDTEDMAMDVASDDDMEETLVREYVEKVSPKVTTTEEDSPNTKSTVAKPNRMGGTSANILGDQSEEKGAAAISKPKDLKGAGNFQNDPKAKAGKTSFKKKESAKKVPDSEKSLLDGPKGKKGK